MAINWGAYWYNSLTLWFYDVLVLRFNMTCLWGCPADIVLLPLFLEASVPSRRHLDIGVATGWFPSVAMRHKFSAKGHTASEKQFDKEKVQEITLMDLNPCSLQTAKHRIQHDNPGATVIHTVQGDALSDVPSSLRNRKFDSISLFNLLHCLPGPQERKNRVFSLAAQVLADDGLLVGNTILGWPYHGWNPLALGMMAFLNAIGGFGNGHDEVDVFERGMRREFREVETWVVGSMLLFRASGPRRAAT